MIEIAIISVISIWLNGCSSKVNSDKFIKNTNQQIDEIIKYIENKEKGIENKYKMLNYNDGYGKYDNCKYYGEVKNSKPHGFGKAIYELYKGKRKVYIGEWKKGMYHGKGIKKTNILESNKGIYDYVGSFKNGEYNGLGKIYYENGETYYLGNFLNGSLDGFGIIFDEKGRKIVEGNYLILNYFDDDIPRIYEGIWLDENGDSEGLME
jgi:hypothetical protein